MQTEQRLLKQVIAAHREGDLDECVRWVRTLVYAAPLATAPRHLLASLYMLTGEHRLALLHYRRLLSPAIENGEVFRSIALQKQIDDLLPARSLDSARWVSMRTRLRAHGVPPLPGSASSVGRPWLEAQFLGLSRAWFERVVTEGRTEVVGVGVAPEVVGVATVWEVVAGRLPWSYTLPDGRENPRAEAAEGDAIHIPSPIVEQLRVSFFPDLPVELLRFDAAMAAELRHELALRRGQGAAGEARPAHQLGPAHAAWTTRVQELAGARPKPTEETGPKVLGLPSPGVAPPSEPSDSTGDWLESGQIALPDGPEATDGDRAPAPPAADDTSTNRRSPVEPSPEPTLAAAPPERRVSARARRRRKRRASALGPVAEANAGSVEPRAKGRFAGSIPAPEPAAPGSERRRHPRVAVSFETRVALLRLRGSRVPPLRGELIDLSSSGLGLRVDRRGLGAAGGALAQAVVAVELDVPGPGGPLQVAGQVRRIEVDEARDEARIGIEFLLMTEPDRRRVSATIAGVALANRDPAPPTA
ncbi:MAG: hypothetical protein E6K81_04710 [Candidatus Eisenbacteria bacterium]|uniref:PilZ domain-containing protein n=1 Tax=Eiseniibacteriota bacterium TaxID=2212470 RepID=A0A538UC41_UNCEI|nr:MAG: hypothetical protein E6K81_04710 [Candidatus Eisenbacteria bacterium]